MWKTILKDIKANKEGELKSIPLVVCFRISHWFTQNRWLKIIGLPWRLFYKILAEWIYHFELKDVTQIGPGFQIFHGGHGSVIDARVIIGDNVSIRHNTGIGGRSLHGEGRCPVIGNNVFIGPHALILGDFKVGDNSIIAGGAVVVKEVGEGEAVAGNPAKVVKRKV